MDRWMAVVALFVPITAQAAPAADCKALMLGGMNLVIYRTQASFPAEPETISWEFFDDANPAGPGSFCGFSFKPDRATGVLTVTARQLGAFSNLFREGYKNTGRIVLENKLYSSGSQSSNIVFDPKTRLLSFDRAGSAIVPLTLGVKIDGASLQPLFYQNTSRDVQVPTTARVIDIYAKTSQGTRSDWQRVNINLKKPTIIFFKKSAFPTK